MFLKKVFLLTVVMFLAIAGTSYAGTDAGMMELGLQGSYTQTKIDDEDFKFYLGYFNFGYFLTPQLQLGALGMFGGNINGETNRIYGISADFRYNFSYDKAQTVVPYLGIQAGVSGISDGTNESAFAYGAMGGIKFFVTERASLNFGVNWVRTRIEDTDIDTFMGSVGFSVYFGK